FFSSRRRHTRSYGDWSSDVCSSDLPYVAHHGFPLGGRKKEFCRIQLALQVLKQARQLGTGGRNRDGLAGAQGGRGVRGFEPFIKIGRASCRERVRIEVVGGEVKERM